MHHGRTGTHQGTGRRRRHGPRSVLHPAKGNRVKVVNRVVSAPSLLGRAIVAIPLLMAIFIGAFTAPAHAITRKTVMKRANHWIKKKVKYSQSSYYRGYRRDCSGFVSMAWKLKKSYTSSTIRSKAKRISWRKLKRGDAVRRPGHVEVFGGWKNKKKRQYWALEESTWGKPAMRRVKTFKRGYSALRYKGITKPKTKRRTSTPAPVAPGVPSLDTTGSLTPSVPVSGSVDSTLVGGVRPLFAFS